jgi:hypothetical protein
MASMVNTNCDCDSCIEDVSLDLIAFLGGLSQDKSKSAAFLERNRKNCESERERDKLAMMSSTSGMTAPSGGGGAPIVELPSGETASATYDDTNVRGAVASGNGRIWILDTYGVRRVRAVDAATLRPLADVAVPAGGQALGIARSGDKSTVYFTRSYTTASSVTGAVASPSAILEINAATSAVSMFLEFSGLPRFQHLAASPDGRWLIATSAEGVTSITQPSPNYIHFVDVARRRVANRVEVPSLPTSIVFTPDSALAFGLDGNNVVVMDVQSNTVARRLQVLGAQNVLAMSPEGDRLYVGGAYVWPYQTIGTARQGVAMIDTSSLEPVGYIPYTEPGVRREIVALATHPAQGTLHMSFFGEQGYYVAHPEYREIDVYYKPATGGSLEITHILIDAA